MNRLLLITDGPAAAGYTLPLMSMWRSRKHIIRTAPTAAAQLFQNLLGWSAFSGTPSTSFEALTADDMEWPEAVVIAPASIRLLEQLAGSVITANLAIRKTPVIVIPALLPSDNQDEAIKQLSDWLPKNWHCVPPLSDSIELGALGQLAVASQTRCDLMLNRSIGDGILSGKHILLTAGPTVEDVDPVRFISNRSTGKMGVALALAALRHGAHVKVIHGPMQASLPAMPGMLEEVAIRSAREMYRATMDSLASSDMAILCAAVADYSPGICAAHKIKKQGNDGLHLALLRTPDILASIGKLEKRPFLVGFAAESDDVEANAALKLQTKKCDIVCANDVMAPGCGFAVSTNRVTMVFKDGTSNALPLLSKDETAERIILEATRRAFA